MSTHISKEISCPNCAAIQKTEMWPGIDCAEHPELREQILDETLFNWKCQNCGYEAQMVYPCLYHDKKHKFMICLEFDGHTEFEMPPYLDCIKKRYVSSLPQLKEKILLFEADLNDTAMELVKLALSEVVQKKWHSPTLDAYFCSCNSNQIEFAFFWQGKKEPIYQSTNQNVYKQATELLRSIDYSDDDEFLTVDHLLAQRLLEEYQNS